MGGWMNEYVDGWVDGWMDVERESMREMKDTLFCGKTEYSFLNRFLSFALSSF
jgi:hypothetical protein